MASTSVPPPPRPETYSYQRKSDESYTRKSGGSNDDDKAAAGFAALAIAHAGLAIPLLFRPHETAEFLLGGNALPHNVEHEHLLGMLAAGLLGGAAASWALKGAAEEGDLDSESSEGLQLGLMGMAVSAVAVHIIHREDITRGALGAGGAAAALTFAVPAARMLASDRGRRRLGNRVKGFFSGLGRVFDFRHGFKLSTALYGALTPAFFAAGAAYILAPQATLGNVMGYILKRPDSVFLWRNIGGALMTVMPAITYSLKEKADDDQLNQATPRVLNTGLLLASLGHLVVLGPIANDGTGGRYLPLIVGTWAAGLAASLAGLSSSATSRRV